MVFPSYEFAFFFVVVLALSWALMPHPRAWKPFVLAASYLFYAAASPRYCLLLAGVTLANQAGAVLVHRTEDERRRKWIVGVTVAIDLGVLGLFKYYGFFVDEFSAFLDALDLGMPLPLLTLALPIGLSFITFQAISYVVDVKRGLLPPASLIDFALYLSFFPHVVAGPIVRAREFIPQLSKPRDPRDVAVGAAVVLIALGLIKKVALADYLAREVVDPVFGVPEAYSAPDVALAAYAYAAQIYCDFSGYTDIAIGVALLMGFVFPQNFNSPYRATSFRDFNGPGESKHADIGISLPGTFEEPVAPVFIDGKLDRTLRGDGLVAEFIDILEDYVAAPLSRPGERPAIIEAARIRRPPHPSADRLPRLYRAAGRLSRPPVRVYTSAQLNGRSVTWVTPTSFFRTGRSWQLCA